MSGRRGGIPGPESRTGLVRPAMTEAEFDRRQARAQAEGQGGGPHVFGAAEADADDPAPGVPAAPAADPEAPARLATRAARATRARPPKARRVQRMFAIEEELDKKLWLYAIHVGKDRSEVVNDLLRPLVASMVLYDSRDRTRSSRAAEVADPEGQGGSPD